jgi:hypothetical protein
LLSLSFLRLLALQNEEEEEEGDDNYRRLLRCAGVQFHKRKKKATAAAVTFFVALEHNAAKQEAQESVFSCNAKKSKQRCLPGSRVGPTPALAIVPRL